MVCNCQQHLPFDASFRHDTIRPFVNQRWVSSSSLINVLIRSEINLWQLPNISIQNLCTMPAPSSFRLLNIFTHTPDGVFCEVDRLLLGIRSCVLRAAETFGLSIMLVLLTPYFTPENSTFISIRC